MAIPTKTNKFAAQVEQLEADDELEQEKNRSIITKNPAPAQRGRPKGSKGAVQKKAIIAYLPDSLRNQLDQFCMNSGMSKSSVICKALYDFLKENQEKAF